MAPLDQLEVGGEFPGTEIRAMEALTLGGTAVEHRQVLRLGIVGHGGVGEGEMRLDDVGHVPQQSGGALLPVALDDRAQAVDSPAPHRLSNVPGRNLAAQLVAAQILEADRLQDMDAVDRPADGGLPVDRLQDAACGGGRHHVVRYPLDFHLRPREAGVLAPDVQFHSVSH